MATPGDALRADRASETRNGGSALGPIEVVESPEQVRLELELAGPMSRAFAFSLDYTLILLLMTALVLVLVSGLEQIFVWAAEFPMLRDLLISLTEWIGQEGGEEASLEPMLRGMALVFGVWLLLDLTLTCIYFTLFETLAGGRTPGKRVTRLRVVTERGGQVGVREALLRNLLRLVDSLPTGHLLGMLAVIVSKRSQRFGDLVAGTLVIREPETVAADPLELRPIPESVEAEFRFSANEVRAVGEVERRLIRRTLQRAETLSDRAAGPIVARTAEAIRARIGRDESVRSERQRDFLAALLQASERLR